jgi:glycerophosphoryl diester phosphodiesterase
MIDVQGHRGARGLRPENTLAGFELAIDLGVTTLEMDVGMSADGILVVCHDSFINPKLCLAPDGNALSPEPLLWLKDLLLVEIQSFDCGSLNPDPIQFSGQVAASGAKIPTLQQVFDRAEAKNPDIRYNIESKVTPLRSNQTFAPEVFAEKLIAIFEQNHLIERAMIQSFDWRVLRRVKQLNPAIQTVALVTHTEFSSTLIKPEFPSGSPFLAGFNFADFEGDVAGLLRATGFVNCYSPNAETLLPESPYFLQAIDTVQQAGFPVIPWTVNDPDLMQRLLGMGVDGLITDYPDRLLVLLTELEK